MNERKCRKPFLKTVKVMNVDAMTKEGEVYTAEKRFQVVEEEDKTFKLAYSELVVFLNSTESLVDVKVFNWVLEHLGYNDSKITLTKPNKEAIADSIGFSYSAVEKAIGSLAKKDILVKDAKYPRGGAYNVNPSYAWYGSTSAREGKLKTVLEMIQTNNMPDREREREEDIKRYAEHVKKNKK